MSLVDYASSSDDDVSDAEEQQRLNDPSEALRNESSAPNSQKSESSSNRKPESSAPSLPAPLPSIGRLPDASLLLNASSISVVSGNDHASGVAAAMAESATRKRDSNALRSTVPRNKLPKGTLPHSKNVLDTAGGLLVPPQLSGRSNVVTEDMSKLFVKKRAEP